MFLSINRQVFLAREYRPSSFAIDRYVPSWLHWSRSRFPLLNCIARRTTTIRCNASINCYTTGDWIYCKSLKKLAIFFIFAIVIFLYRYSSYRFYPQSIHGVYWSLVSGSGAYLGYGRNWLRESELLLKSNVGSFKHREK